MENDHQDKDGIIQAVENAISKCKPKPDKITKARRNTSLKRISVDTFFRMPDREEMVSVKLRGTYDEWNKIESHAKRKLLYRHVDHLFNERTRPAIKETFRERWGEFADGFHSIIQAAQGQNPLSTWKIRKASPYPIGFKFVAKQLYGYLQAWRPQPFATWPVFLRRCFEEYQIDPIGNPVDATLTILEHRYNLRLTGKGYSDYQRSQNFYGKYLSKITHLKPRLANPSFTLPPGMAELFSPFCPCLKKYFHQDKIKPMADHPF